MIMLKRNKRKQAKIAEGVRVIAPFGMRPAQGRIVEIKRTGRVAVELEMHGGAENIITTFARDELKFA